MRNVARISTPSGGPRIEILLVLYDELTTIAAHKNQR
jgi:hypothetical protein